MLTDIEILRTLGIESLLPLLKRENTVVNNGSQLCQKSFYPHS